APRRDNPALIVSPASSANDVGKTGRKTGSQLTSEVSESITSSGPGLRTIQARSPSTRQFLFTVSRISDDCSSGITRSNERSSKIALSETMQDAGRFLAQS